MEDALSPSREAEGVPRRPRECGAIKAPQFCKNKHFSRAVRSGDRRDLVMGGCGAAAALAQFAPLGGTEITI